MSEPIKRLWVGIQGSPEYVADFINRIAYIAHITQRNYPKDKGHGEISVSLTCYTSHDRHLINPTNLADLLASAEIEIQELSAALGEAELEIERLKQELGQLPKPQPGDMVLGKCDSGKAAREIREEFNDSRA